MACIFYKYCRIVRKIRGSDHDDRNFMGCCYRSLVGIISDNRDPRKGRRRPFLLVCAIPFGIVTWLLFTAWDFVEIQQKIYFIIVALLFYTFQTLIDVPYTSLSGEVTDNYDLRSKLATIRTFWAIIGVAIGGGIMAYTDF